MQSFLFLCDFNLYSVEHSFFLNKFLQENVCNHLHPNISMHILHTVLYMFLRCRKGEFVFIRIT